MARSKTLTNVVRSTGLEAGITLKDRSHNVVASDGATAGDSLVGVTSATKGIVEDLGALRAALISIRALRSLKGHRLT